MRPRSLGALLLLLAALLYPAGAQGQQEDQAAAPPALKLEIHSGFWVNLHHFLYLQGRIQDAESTDTRGSRAQPAFAARASTDGMTAGQRKAWNEALRIYAADWSTRDLENNGDMVRINDRLAELGNCADLSGKGAPGCAAGLRPDLMTALEEAAPIYRARWWAEQDRANRAWIARVAPLLRKRGSRFAQQLSEVYQSDWPNTPIRVDVVWYAGPRGAYTTLEPPHVVLSSRDVRNQEAAAFQVLFDQASLTLAEGVREEIVRQCRQREKLIPRDLWPALVDYTTDALLRRGRGGTAGNAGPGAVTQPGRNELAAHGWSRYQNLLERFWQPYLDGRTDLDTAVARMVSSL